jgi:hypothetical protein
VARRTCRLLLLAVLTVVGLRVLGAYAPLAPPAAAQVQPPTALFLGAQPSGSCGWMLTFALTGFTPNSPVTATASGERFFCDRATYGERGYFGPNDFVIGQFDRNGSFTWQPKFNDWGTYNYCFRDGSGRRACVTAVYNVGQLGWLCVSDGCGFGLDHPTTDAFITFLDGTPWEVVFVTISEKCIELLGPEPAVLGCPIIAAELAIFGPPILSDQLKRNDHGRGVIMIVQGTPDNYYLPGIISQ